MNDEQISELADELIKFGSVDQHVADPTAQLLVSDWIESICDDGRDYDDELKSIAVKLEAALIAKGIASE